MRTAVIDPFDGVPLIATVSPTANWACVAGAALVPNFVELVISTVSCAPLAARTVHVDPASAMMVARIARVARAGADDDDVATPEGAAAEPAASTALVDPLVANATTPTDTTATTAAAATISPMRLRRRSGERGGEEGWGG